MRKLYFLVIMTLSTALMHAQTNLFSNGTFDDSADWSTFNVNSDNGGEITFTGGVATFSDIESFTGDNVQYGIYQAVTLPIGTYQIDFSMSFTEINQAWGELWFGTAEPTSGNDYKGEQGATNIGIIFNTWDCGRPTTYNGLASTYSGITPSDASKCTSSDPLQFTVTTEDTYYIVFKSGSWQGTYGTTNVIIDNMTLYDTATLSVSNFDIENFSIYPNPTRASWLISSKKDRMLSVEIYNLLGKKVIDLEPNSLSAEIETSSISSGVYISKIKTDSGSLISKKLVKI